jgi:hypothetical protein
VSLPDEVFFNAMLTLRIQGGSTVYRDSLRAPAELLQRVKSISLALSLGSDV